MRMRENGNKKLISSQHEGGCFTHDANKNDIAEHLAKLKQDLGERFNIEGVRRQNRDSNTVNLGYRS